MHATIEAMKADALRQIRTNLPQLNSEGLYVCKFCGANSSDRGIQFWHNCALRELRGIKVRIVR